MTAIRQLPRDEYVALKAATKRLIKLNGGGNAAALVTRVGQQQLSDYANLSDDHDGVFMPIDVVADLEAECGEPVVTRLLAEFMGRLLAEIPRAPAAEDPVGALCRVTKECADVTASYSAALADQDITPAEARGVLKEIADAEAACASLKAMLRPIAARGGDL